MKYPKDIGPQSQTEFLAVMFTMLGNAYNLLAQYEADEMARDEATRRDKYEEFLAAPSKFARPNVRTEAAHREDEEQ